MTNNINQSTSTRMLPWIICGLAAIFYCYEYFLRVLPSVMTVDLMRSFDVSAVVFGNLSAFYYYAYTPMQLPVGVMMDHWGPRKLLTLACFSCAIGTYMFANADHYYFAAAGRFLVGFGSAFAFVGVLKLATLWMPAERFALMAGIASSLGTFGGIAGDIGLTKMVSDIGWYDTIMFAAVAGVALTAIIFIVVRDGPAKVSHAPKKPSDFRHVFVDLFKIVKKRQMWINGLIGCTIYIPTTAFAELWGIPYLQQAQGFSQENAALGISALFLGWGICAPLVGYISDHMDSRRIPLFVGALTAVVLSSSLIFIPDLSSTTTYILLFLLGASYSVQVLVFAVGCELCPPRAAGTAIAMTNMMVMVGGAIFQPIVGYLLEWSWKGELLSGVHIFSAGEYRIALSIIPIALFTSAMLVLMLKETHPNAK